ncbi:MAG TPA: phosphate ABC transporter substrate-binding protein PstS [Candidatus Dormibacteraeota bacterium]|nr:phosphate ABC transporter substrate-binding protein PstS [Candidatus Dormibacteraeota bacterium]
MTPLRTLLAVPAMLAIVACGGSTPTPSASSTPAVTDVGSGSISGAGSTFVAPFYNQAFYEYNQKYPNVAVNYQAIGSGGGIKQFTAGTVDFGATDLPMTSTELAAAGGDAVLVEVPTVLGAVSVAYNLPGVDKLQLDGATLADIYLGKVKTWNDPEITALNPGVTLPSKPITVAHRSDGSGTSYAFTDYLAKVSPAWKSGPGVGKSVSWPVGIGGSGNQAVAQAVQSTEDAIGYVELAYVIQSHMQQAYMKNGAGKFLQASAAGATAAAAGLSNVSATNFSITNMDGADAYPIASFSWVLLKKSYSDAQKTKALVYLFKWLTTDGQTLGNTLDYAPIPSPVQAYALAQLKLVTAGGTPILK